MIEIISQIVIPEEILELTRIFFKHMAFDASNYAKNRKRVWIGQEWHLLNRKFIDAPEPESARKLLDWSKSVINKYHPWEPEIGLLTWSGEQAKGILPHRDDSYADYESWGINLLGECQFEYNLGYKGFQWSKERETGKITVNLSPGHIWRFNCKNIHAAIPSKNRLGLNLWRISSKYRDMF